MGKPVVIQFYGLYATDAHLVYTELVIDSVHADHFGVFRAVVIKRLEQFQQMSYCLRRASPVGLL